MIFVSDILEIRDLFARVENKEILKGVNLTVKTGEVHAIMVLVNLLYQVLLWGLQNIKFSVEMFY